MLQNQVLQSGRKGGKSYLQFQAFIQSIRRGENNVLFGPEYAVISLEKFNELNRCAQKLAELEQQRKENCNEEM